MAGLVIKGNLTEAWCRTSRRRGLLAAGFALAVIFE